MKRMYIKTVVANLLSEPICYGNKWVDRNMETQLLKGDSVNVLQESGDFAFVEVLNQDIFYSHSGWSLYKGYVKQETLSLAPVQSEPAVLGSDVIKSAKQFLGSRYLWGGCSFPINLESTPFRGVDCSGLVHLVYNRRLPRNAHDQFLKTERVLFEELIAGDLIFTSESGLEGRIDHVCLVSGDNKLIEAVMSEGIVREISFQEKFGQMPKVSASSQMIGSLGVYPSRFFD